MSALPTGIFVLTILLFLVIQSPLGKMMRPPHAELEELAASGTPRRRRKDVAPVMQVITSAVIIASALAIILSHEFEAKDKHWAYASAGVVLGFWLKE
jgi:hypothetical protein